MEKSGKKLTFSSFLAISGAAFALGVVVGAAVVAIIDYRDEKISRLYKLRRDADENYIYSD